MKWKLIGINGRRNVFSPCPFFFVRYLHGHHWFNAEQL